MNCINHECKYHINDEVDCPAANVCGGFIDGGKVLFKITIPIEPRTKKNSGQMVKTKTGKSFLLPSKAFREYQLECGYILKRHSLHLDTPLNIKAVYFMGTRRKVDITNLNSALHDILVHYDVIADDNMRIVLATDGSRVRYDKQNPRTELTITALEEDTGF